LLWEAAEVPEEAVVVPLQPVKDNTITAASTKDKILFITFFPLLKG
jgi:hypothetical protein